jgi:hypothetical protein
VGSLITPWVRWHFQREMNKRLVAIKAYLEAEVGHHAVGDRNLFGDVDDGIFTKINGQTSSHCSGQSGA